MQTYLLYGHGGSGNHGAEAIVRTTAAMLRAGGDCRILLSAHFPEQDAVFGLPVDGIFAPDPAAWAREKAATTPAEKTRWAEAMYRQALAAIDSGTTLLSVGGDNYCYPTWHRLAVFQQRAARVGAKSILWGCSIEPAAINGDMLAVLASHSAIVARESLTLAALQNHGLGGKAILAPDPAFFLAPETFALPPHFVPGHTIGINLGPLTVRREPRPGVAKASLLQLVQYLLDNTPLAVAFIPHVTMPADDDYGLLAEIVGEFPEKYQNRMVLLDKNLSAAQLKYAIGQCQALVCARTHASIAAYSQYVPCLVLGHSVKARGIARDIGMDDWVIPLDTLTDGRMLLDKFLDLYEKKYAVKQRLCASISPRTGVAQYRRMVAALQF